MTDAICEEEGPKLESPACRTGVKRELLPRGIRHESLDARGRPMSAFETEQRSLEARCEGKSQMCAGQVRHFRVLPSMFRSGAGVFSFCSIYGRVRAQYSLRVQSISALAFLFLEDKCTPRPG